MAGDTYVDFTPPAELIDLLAKTGAQLDDLAPAFVEISRAMENDVRTRILAGVSPPLSPETLRYRTGGGPPLINSGAMFGTLTRRVDPGSASVFMHSAAARLHDSYGREAGFGTLGDRKKKIRAGRRTRKDTRGREASEAAGIRTRSWPAMPVRPFMYLTETRIDASGHALLDYVFKFWDE